MQFKLYHERSSQVYSIFIDFDIPSRSNSILFLNIAADGSIQWIFAVHNMKRNKKKTRNTNKYTRLTNL